MEKAESSSKEFLSLVWVKINFYIITLCCVFTRIPGVKGCAKCFMHISPFNLHNNSLKTLQEKIVLKNGT